MIEYAIVSLATVGATVDADRVATLNQYGAQGWQLVTVIRDSAVRDLAFFMRNGNK